MHKLGEEEEEYKFNSYTSHNVSLLPELFFTSFSWVSRRQAGSWAEVDGQTWRGRSYSSFSSERLAIEARGIELHDEPTKANIYTHAEC